MEKQMEKALEKIKELELKLNNYSNILKEKDNYIFDLENNAINSSVSNISSINHILIEADEAMKRNVAKMRKECEKNAKQKQSKRQ
jgi:hypothetical protein